MFESANKLKSINLYNALNKKLYYITNLRYNMRFNNVCQKDDNIITEKEIKTCYDYNFETNICDPDNYIKVKFKKS